MATSSANMRRPLGDVSAEHGRAQAGAGQRAPFAATLALTVTLAVAGVAVLIALVLLPLAPTRLAIPLTQIVVEQQNKTAKAALYLVTFAVVLPLALIAVPRVADAIARGPNGPALAALTGTLAATLAATILVVKLSALLPWGDGLGVVLAALGVWWVAAGATLARAAQPRPWPRLLGMAGSASGFGASAVAAALGLGTLLCTTTLGSLSPVALVLGVVVVCGALLIYGRRRIPRLPPRWGTAMDAVIVVVALLAVPDMVVFDTSLVGQGVFSQTGAIASHHDFLLGPANQVLAGGTLLVDSPVSQYGVGVVYFLAGWFELAPIGHGTYGLLDGALTALLYVAAYSLLRVAHASRLLAGCALAVGVAALVYGLDFPVGGLPQLGPLRFGLPLALILATVAGARWPRRAGAGAAVALAVVGVASVWAVEALAYTAATFAAMACLQAWMLPAEDRLRWLARQLALAVAACAGAHLLFAAATLAVTGELPDWGQYWAFVHALLLGGSQSEVIFPFARWSPGLAVGAGYVASAAAIVLLAARRPDIVRRERTALIALAGTTAYGIALYSYFDSRSATYLLLYVSLPALLTGALWLALLLSSPRDASPRTRLMGLACALAVAVLLMATAWSSAGDRLPRSPLGHAYPGGGLRDAVDRLWHPPPLDPRVPAGERLLARYMPGQRHVLVVLPATPDRATEILLRSGRANALPLGDSISESWVASSRQPALRRAIARLAPGDRLLTDRGALALLGRLSAQPSVDPIATPSPGVTPLDAWILKEIGARFQLRPVYQGADGYVVAELARG